MVGYSRLLICDYAIKAAPLWGLIPAAGQTKASTELKWTTDTEGAFQCLKTDMQTAPALGNPDYAKPFHLYVGVKVMIGRSSIYLIKYMPSSLAPGLYSHRLEKQVTKLYSQHQNLESNFATLLTKKCGWWYL